MNDQWHALIFVSSPDGEVESPVHSHGPTPDDVRTNLRILLGRGAPCRVRQDGELGYTELRGTADVDRFVQEQLTIERM